MKDLRDHPEARVDSVIRYRDVDGNVTTPKVVARIVYVPCSRKRSTYRVQVYDWGEHGDAFFGAQDGRARGYGYDRRTAAMAGLVVAGVELGDHCDAQGRPTLDDWIRSSTSFMLVRGGW